MNFAWVFLMSYEMRIARKATSGRLSLPGPSPAMWDAQTILPSIRNPEI